MDIIHTNSSFCGSGKTFDATTTACHGIAQSKKTCIAVPSRRLAKQVKRDACKRFPELTITHRLLRQQPQEGRDRDRADHEIPAR